MGREIRRVPKDFDFPLNKTWSGYLHPDTLHGEHCSPCGGNGRTPASLWVQAIGLMIEDIAQDLSAQEHGKKAHPYLTEHMPHEPRTTGKISEDKTHWVQEPAVMRPTPDFQEFVQGLLSEEEKKVHERRATGPFSSYSYQVGLALVRAAGLDIDTWGICPACEGHGTTESYPGQRADYDAWEATEPPTGEGWQLWQTVSEGGPISPVFETPEELARWMASPAYHWGVSRPMKYEDALAFVKGPAWAPSFIVTGSHGLETGEDFTARTEIKKQQEKAK